MTGRIVQFRNRMANAARGGRATPPEGGRTPSSPRPQDPVLPAWGGSRGTATSASMPPPASRFRNLVLPHMDSAYSMARYLSRDAVVAEDVAQEALLRAYRGFDGYRGGDPKAWLLAIVRNTWFDHGRARRGAVFDVGAAQAMDEIADSEPDAEARLIRRGDVEALRGAVQALPEPFREALVLRELEELSYKAIAGITGVPMGTVMSRLARARALLARNLGHNGETAP